MKTKIKKVGLIYAISIVVLFIISLWLSAHFVYLSWWIWRTSLCIAFVLLYVMVRYSVKYFLILKFEEYLRHKIYKKWPGNTEFPLQEDIERWINNYRLSVEGRFSKSIWDKIMKTEEACIQDILKQLVVPVIGVERGLSLYDLHSAPTINPSKVNTGNTTKDSQEMGAYLEHLPVKSLVCCLQMPMQLTPPALYRLVIRQDKVGNFAAVCKALMEAHCEIIAPMDVIEQLISETNAVVPVVFPQRFLAYLIKMEVENRFHLKSDPEKRKKVFDWYMSQTVQEFDFYSYWPKFTEEELQYVLATFEGDNIRDEIFVAQQDWKYVSIDRLRVEYNKGVHGSSRFLIPEELIKEIIERQESKK